MIHIWIMQHSLTVPLTHTIYRLLLVSGLSTEFWEIIHAE